MCVGPATSVIVSADSNSPAAGDLVTITVNALDLFGNIDLSFNGNIRVNYAGTPAAQYTVAIASGVGSVQVTQTVPGNAVVSLTDVSSFNIDVSSTTTLVFSHGRL